MAKIVRTSEMVEEMKPVWAEFIVSLGYTQEQCDQFAEGYAQELSSLPIMEKLDALENKDDQCMSAGFEAAGIDEDEAFERAQSL